MQQTAKLEGIAPEALALRNSDEFRAMGKLLNSSNDDFIRTTEERHHQTSRDIWNRMAENGDIYKDSYAGWYSVRDEAYYQENETEKRADGLRYGPQGTVVEWVQEESYFFRLSQYQDKLLALYESDPGIHRPLRAPQRGDVLRQIGAARPVDLTHHLRLGHQGAERPIACHVCLGRCAHQLPDRDWLSGRSQWPPGKFWPADVHVIGKDIIRFHAVYWPAFLMSAGLPLPKRIFAHGFVLAKGGEKMSKSLGNVLDPFELIAHFGLDPIRYFLMREISFGQDGNCSEDAIGTRINADLANGIGNLASRSLSMIVKNCDGKIPECGPLSDEDKAMLAQVDALADITRDEMGKQMIHRALAAIIAVVSETDRYFAGQEPWALKRPISSAWEPCCT